MKGQRNQDRPLKIGTRGSPLALAQAGSVAEALSGANPGITTELVTIKTSGDGNLLAGDKSRFVKEVEEALLAGDVDIAVHSAKDLPAERTEGLEIAAVPARANVCDVYVGRGSSVEEIEQGVSIGTSSLRRRSQLLAIRPDLQTRELRGNVDTRLRKVAEGEFDGIVLAAAGLERLERKEEASFAFEPDELVPAPGQGALAVQARSDEEPLKTLLVKIGDGDSLTALMAERAVVGGLEADCHTPMGALARLENGELTLTTYVGLPDGTHWIRDRVAGDPSEPEKLGGECAERLLAAGAESLLDSARQMQGERA